MAKYKVIVYKTTYERIIVEVDSGDKESAKQNALEEAYEEYEWDYIDQEYSSEIMRSPKE